MILWIVLAVALVSVLVWAWRVDRKRRRSGLTGSVDVHRPPATGADTEHVIQGRAQGFPGITKL